MPIGIYDRTNYLKSENRFRPRGKSCPQYKHGMCETRFYRCYKSMKTRCNNKNIKDHKTYYDKGIKCEWKDFLEFKVDMYDKYLDHVIKFGESNTTLDRIDSNKNYNKENCRWATLFIQSNNRSNNISVTIGGVTKNIAEWAIIYKIDRKIIYDRIHKLKWDKIKAAITPKKINQYK